MSRFDEAQERDMILFVGSYLPTQKKAVAKLSRMLERELTACVILDDSDMSARVGLPLNHQAIVLECDFSKEIEIQKALLAYKSRFLAVTCRAEKNIPLLKKVVPHVPYLNTPTEKSLDWTTDKIKMRQLLRGYDRSIAPKFVVAHDASKETLDRIERVVGFPLIIKPSGLAASLLVTLCYHREELEESLKKTVKKIDQIYVKKRGRGEPQILVEEFMEGTMYSIDTYVNLRGVMYHAPLVHVKTGRAVGFEDFFGYMRITPVNLLPHKIEAARRVAEKAVEALNLRSTNCHIELMKTENGWKVIELGPRIGGFRHEMYELSYGMDHSMNDILIRIPKKPVLPKKTKGVTVVMQFYARQKGRLVSLEGINKARKLESFSTITIKKKLGDMCDFARNGDDPVFDIVLFNKDRSRILADIRRLEQAIAIKVQKPRTKQVVSR
ncbi:ATP-grasp domain-containing protein [Candidatus Saccharibacteria bacterium]|nr:ATP-grasp domain-containing protein [Candidatus Saccharibacteria bacterium]